MALSPIQLKKHDNRKNSGGWGGGGWRWQGSEGGEVDEIWKTKGRVSG